MNLLFTDNNTYKQKAKELMRINREKFTLNSMIGELDKIMEKHMKSQPKQVSIKLPKLKKVKETV